MLSLNIPLLPCHRLPPSYKIFLVTSWMYVRPCSLCKGIVHNFHHFHECTKHTLFATPSPSSKSVLQNDDVLITCWHISWKNLRKLWTIPKCKGSSNICKCVCHLRSICLVCLVGSETRKLTFHKRHSWTDITNSQLFKYLRVFKLLYLQLFLLFLVR